MIATETLADDVERWQRVADGDTAAFAEIVDRHKDSLVNYLTRLTGDPDRAQDLAQETFLRLYSHAGRYRERGHLTAYIFRIATNLLRSERRRESRWRLLRPLFERANGHRQSPQAATELLQRETDRQVQAAISRLPLAFRAPLVLHEIEGWPYARIARTLGCREGTVKSRIHRARQKLKGELEDYWNEGVAR